MSTPGRPKGEYRSAQREGSLMSTPGRPKGEYRSAQREGCQMSAAGPFPRRLSVSRGTTHSAEGAA